MITSSANGQVPLPAASKSKGMSAFFVRLTGGIPRVVTFTASVDSFTVQNISNQYVRGTITWDAAVTPVGNNTILIAPNGQFSVNLKDEDYAAVGINAIASISLVPVTLPAAAGAVLASTLTVSTQPAIVIVNGVES